MTKKQSANKIKIQILNKKSGAPEATMEVMKGSITTEIMMAIGYLFESNNRKAVPTQAIEQYMAINSGLFPMTMQKVWRAGGTTCEAVSKEICRIISSCASYLRKRGVVVSPNKKCFGIAPNVVVGKKLLAMYCYMHCKDLLPATIQELAVKPLAKAKKARKKPEYRNLVEVSWRETNLLSKTKNMLKKSVVMEVLFAVASIRKSTVLIDSIVASVAEQAKALPCIDKSLNKRILRLPVKDRILENIQPILYDLVTGALGYLEEVGLLTRHSMLLARPHRGCDLKGGIKLDGISLKDLARKQVCNEEPKQVMLLSAIPKSPLKPIPAEEVAPKPLRNRFNEHLKDMIDKAAKLTLSYDNDTLTAKITVHF